MVTILLAASAAAYIIQFLLLIYGLRRADRVRKQERRVIPVSVIVAARNEESSILDCMRSIEASDYPAEALEILVINDRSTDRTGPIVDEFAREHRNVRLFTSSEGTGQLRGKANALAQGIAVATGKILLFTDADCRVHPRWVSETVSRFGDDVALVGGYTLLDTHSVFQGIQAIDWIFLFSLAASSAGLNLPLTAIGNNLAVRRSAYDATGGYGAIPFSVTEDYAIVRAVLHATGQRLVFPADPDRVVYSSACPGWKELYRQKKRWGTGGLDMVFRGHLLMSVGWLFSLFLLLGLFLASSTVYCAAAAGKLFIDLLFLWRPMRVFGRLRLLRYFPLFEVYLTLYVFLLPFIVAFNRRVVWKGRRF